jgi:hypothetical protein
MQFWFASVISKYVNFLTFLEDSLTVCIIWFCPVFCSLGINVYLVSENLIPDQPPYWHVTRLLWFSLPYLCFCPINQHYQQTPEADVSHSVQYLLVCHRRWDRSVSIVTRLWAWRPSPLCPAAADVSPLQNIQTGSEAHPTAYSMVTEGSVPREIVRLTTHL